MLFSIVENPEISANDLNHDLDVIHQWAHQWKLEFNPDPTKQTTEVLFSCKKSSPNHPQIMFNGTVVARMNGQKHLGLILDSSLSFKKHLNEKIIKAKKNLGIIKHLFTFLPRKALDQMYKFNTKRTIFFLKFQKLCISPNNVYDLFEFPVRVF